MLRDNMLQKLIPMKISCLSFCFTFSLIFMNFKQLFSQEKHVNNTSTIENCDNNDFKALVENIYEQLQQKHSIDEIIKTLNSTQNNPYDIQMLANRINELLIAQNSKHNTVNFIAASDEAKKYYACKNSTARIKAFYALLRIVIIIVAVIIIYYFLSSFFKFPFPGASLLFSSSSSRQNTEHNQSASQNQNVINPQVIDNPQRNILEQTLLNNKQYTEIKRQFENAKQRGLIPTDVNSTTVSTNIDQNNLDPLTYNLQIEQQLKLARERGLLT